MRWLSVAILSVLCGLAIPSAQAAQKVHSSLDLTTDPKVTELEPDFILASRSNVVFAHCNHYWVITPEQVEFQKIAFQRISANYMQAFYDAYIKRVGTPPGSAVVNNYTKYIYAKQDKAQKEISEVIGKRFNGCENGKVVRVLKFIEKMRYADIVEKEKLGQLPAGTVKALGEKKPRKGAYSQGVPVNDPESTPSPTTTEPTTPTPGSH